MRSHILLVLVLLAVCFAGVRRPAAAQAEFGGLGGVTFADITGDDAQEDLDRTVGFLAGAFGRFQLGQIIAFQPEAQFVRKGAEGDFAGGEAAVKLAYIDIPLFLSFGLPSMTAFHVLLGPTFSFEVGCTVDIDTALGDCDGDCDDEDEFDDERKSFVAGATVGVGLDLPLGGLNAFLDGCFNIDLESFAEAEDTDIKNQVFQIVAGLRFPLGG